MTGPVALLVQAILYFGVMAIIFRSRNLLGLGVFVCALGVMHFLETYLAAVFFIRLPFGLISPGSTVMFTGKLAMILMLYIREDAETVRQPIYGLLIGNGLMVLLAAVLRLYTPTVLDGYNPDLTLLDQLGVLMIWGTALLFIDSLSLIMIYERIGRWFGGSIILRATTALAAVLTFDQIFFYAGLRLIAGAPGGALVGGWIAKMVAALLYSCMMAGYLRWFERAPVTAGRQRTGDLFSKLTYRHRYEELLERTGIDALTGVLDRGRFEAIAQSSVARTLAEGRPLSLAIIDVDHFKQINDRYGHVTGDDVLRRIAQALRDSVRTNDKVFRYGGEEFVVLCEGMPHEAALAHAERLRLAIPEALDGRIAATPTVSIGVATAPGDGLDLMQLVHHADLHLYEAKNGGRNRVVGNDGRDGKVALPIR